MWYVVGRLAKFACVALCLKITNYALSEHDDSVVFNGYCVFIYVCVSLW